MASDEIQFTTAGGPCWLDIEEFERRVRAAGTDPGEDLTQDRVRQLEEAVKLYRGDLLENIYEDWTQLERERLKHLFCGALERLMAHHAAHRAWDVAIGWGHRLLGCDPLREHVHRELMRFHHAKGDRPAALRQFQSCADFLYREMGVDPMPETIALYQAMRGGRWRESGVPIPMGAEALSPERSTDPTLSRPTRLIHDRGSRKARMNAG